MKLNKDTGIISFHSNLYYIIKPAYYYILNTQPYSRTTSHAYSQQSAHLVQVTEVNRPMY